MSFQLLHTEPRLLELQHGHRAARLVDVRLLGQLVDLRLSIRMRMDPARHTEAFKVV